VVVVSFSMGVAPTRKVALPQNLRPLPSRFQRKAGTLIITAVNDGPPA
jgi:hypothetical protein